MGNNTCRRADGWSLWIWTGVTLRYSYVDGKKENLDKEVKRLT
jgi:hypothetical protein